MKSVIKSKIKKHVRDYLKSQVERLGEQRDFSEMIVNPFFIGIMKDQLSIETKEKLATALVFEGIIKGLTGSFGARLQKIAGEFTHEPPKEGFHLRIKKNGKFHNIIVVSGPQHNTSNVEKYRSKMENSRKKFPKEVPVFGICYGNKKILFQSFSNNVRTGLKNEKIIIGKEFWEFISGDKDCRNEVLKAITDEAKRFSESEDYETIYETLTKTSEGLNDYFTDMYGKNPKKFWENFFRDVYI
tara:strand:+ start:4939 stop:5667 length:729 start_codon:yes stop_codon:yes gene_type:complete